jgi:hypothetical protein
MIIQRSFLALLWLGFIVYAFVLAPPDQPDTLSLIQNLSIGNWQGINPLIIALFNLMGIWPLIYSGVIYVDGRGQEIPAWPFAVGSFFLGAFMLLPYLILRRPNQPFEGEKTGLVSWFESRLLGVIIVISSLVLLGYGILQGNVTDFIEQWKTSRFINVMSLDFCLLILLFPILLKDDLAKRNVKDPLWFWGISLFPLLGSGLYLIIRPALKSSES